MSTAVIAFNNGSQLTVNYDVAKMFIWNNRYTYAQYTNGTGAPITTLAGTIMGRVAVTGKLLPMLAAASDGSATPVGILVKDYTVLAGATVSMGICIQGDVTEDMIIVSGGTDTLDTVVALQTNRDRLRSFASINPKPRTDMTAFDN
jgi:hypothetical protein